MAMGAVLAAALTNHSARAYGLYIDGFDVLEEPAATKRYGVAIEAIDLTISGPDGVSSLAFTIDDPASLITVTDGQFVRFQDLTNNAILFIGWVQRYALRPAFGMQGRTIDVVCVGVESVLDWAVTAYVLTWTTLQFTQAMLQAVIAAAVGGMGELRYGADPVNYQGSQALPIGLGPFSTGNIDASGNTIPLTIPAGTTMREGLRMALAVFQESVTDCLGFRVTVDHTFGVRIYQRFSPVFMPDGDLSVTVGATDKASDLTYDVDAGGIVRGVTVFGTGVSASVADGTGKRGQTAVITDTSITNATAARLAGVAYLGSFKAGLRGTLGQSDTTVRYNSTVVLRKLVLTDVPTGGSGTYDIASVGFRFYGSKIDYEVNFGGRPPSATGEMRRLTRSTLS